MSIRHLQNSRIFFRFLAWWILFSFFPGLISSAVVTLDSIEIFKTHELIGKPTVYFLCKGENRTELPDVTKTGVVYSFKGEESWQPLTELVSKKCKRCGFYEKDTIKADDIFAEWEFCSSDFKAPKYTLFKEEEFNATFHCPDCTSLPAASNTAPEKHDDGNGMHVAVVILISVLISTVTIVALVMAYKYWQKKKRQQDQARFLKLFEEGDDIEDELGLGTVI
ncbi:PREDICTED: uncharacterized protein LOC18597854 isoform X2 [Theobroma cacao]|nr:PREDICTED: uncharacterized protein LOC18597854 isoform X2 [Theobroma cacao]EOY07658.1 Uncharacterized protein TCM_022042 isoform 1 [Theobroma cacao]EOY07659.1 Uncharacterized protein TCM_022042 isoform 1 [Theobroma cacao]EOY07660.1 Uncharacterized protein TCM_022042 isoform 1 [Theobroma cacao]